MNGRHGCKTLLVVSAALVLVVAADSRASDLPTVSSANLTFHLDAGDMNNDGGATNPGDGNNISSWMELIAGVSVNVQSTPWWRASGLNGNPSVRFDGGPPYGDLVYASNAAIINTQAQTIIGVAGMTADAHVLSNLVSNGTGTSTIRQTTSETAAYYPGNSADFHFGGGSFTINGNPTNTIPGGFGAAHVVKSISPSSINIWSLRIGDNANNRLWSGDVSELLVYDGTLNADDTALVHKYLIDKYGIDQVVDESIGNSSQIATDPFDNGANRHVGVNFHYGGPTVGTTFQGIGFDNIDLTGSPVPPAGPFTLNANAATAGATLTLSFPFTSDNTQRTQNAGIAGTDSATLNAVANEMFYLSTTNHPNALMMFAGLGANRDVFVQVLGGDSGWNGDLQVTANGTPIDADWTTVANGSGNTGSLYGFFADTDSSGQLQLDFSISAGNYAGIGGMMLTMVPEPSTFALAAIGLLGLLACGRRKRT